MSWFLEKATQIHPTDDWDFYFCRVDDKPASIFLDLGRISNIPTLGYPVMSYFRLYMRMPRDDGLSSEEEFQILGHIEDKIEPAASKTGALYVGRKTGDGVRDYYFYTSAPEKFEKVIRSAMMSYPAYQYEIGSRKDDGWTIYRDFLYPDPPLMSVIQNRRVLAILEREGDLPGLPHKIDHRAYFQSEAQRQAFTGKVLGLGYQIEMGNRDGTEDAMFLDFFRSDFLADIDAITTEIHDIIKDTGGEYDGWGTSVEKPENDPIS